MQPSNSPHYIAQLNTKAELSILENAIQKAEPGTPGTIEDSIAARFYTQTKEPVPGLGSLTVEERWKYDAKFNVLAKDASFLILAAQSALTATKPSERVMNRLTRRTKAAKTILDSLVDYK